MGDRGGHHCIWVQSASFPPGTLSAPVHRCILPFLIRREYLKNIRPIRLHAFSRHRPLY
jgi:hypothetical protein